MGEVRIFILILIEKKGIGTAVRNERCRIWVRAMIGQLKKSLSVICKSGWREAKDIGAVSSMLLTLTAADCWCDSKTRLKLTQPANRIRQFQSK